MESMVMATTKIVLLNPALSLLNRQDVQTPRTSEETDQHRCSAGVIHVCDSPVLKYGIS